MSDIAFILNALPIAAAIVILRYDKPYGWLDYVALTLIVCGAVMGTSNLVDGIVNSNAECEVIQNEQP